VFVSDCPPELEKPKLDDNIKWGTYFPRIPYSTQRSGLNCSRKSGEIRNALKISSSFLKESILFILNLDYAEEDE